MAKISQKSKRALYHALCPKICCCKDTFFLNGLYFGRPVYVHIPMQFLFVYFSLQIKNKPHDGVANYAFILEQVCTRAGLANGYGSTDLRLDTSTEKTKFN
jgi:hypothetical protein